MSAGEAMPAGVAARLLERMDEAAELSIDERSLIEQVRRLAREGIAPRARDLDRSGDFPRRNIDEINELGLNGMFVPEEYGGALLSYACYLMALREISAACASTGLTWATNFHATHPIVHFGSPEQKKRILPLVANGALVAIAITETGGGSDASAMRTTFSPEGESVIIRGEKTYITNGDRAEILLVFGKWTPLGKGRDAISAIIVERGDANLKVLRCEDKLGHRASSTAALMFDAVRAPASNMLGAPGQGLSMMFGALNLSRPSVAAHSLGIARAALAEALSYGSSRSVSGKTLLQYQINQVKLSDLFSELLSCEALMWRLARAPDPVSTEFGLMAGMLKAKAGDLAVAMADFALQLHGGAGYCREFRAEQLMRDAKLAPVGEGARELLTTLIGRNLARTDDNYARSPACAAISEAKA